MNKNNRNLLGRPFEHVLGKVFKGYDSITNDDYLRSDISGIAFSVVRSARRKTVSITVNAKRAVIVTVPSKTPIDEILSIVDSKSKWIHSKIVKYNDLDGLILDHNYMTGDQFLFIGKKYNLCVDLGSCKSAVFCSDKIRVVLPLSILQSKKQATTRKLIIELYRKQAFELFNKKCLAYARQMGVSFKSINVRIYKRTWGNCYSDGRINFNIKLIMAPDNVIDYVVVHELCHLSHPNHGKLFWKMVEEFMPNFKALRNYLKNNGSIFEF